MRLLGDLMAARADQEVQVRPGLGLLDVLAVQPRPAPARVRRGRVPGGAPFGQLTFDIELVKIN